MSRKENHISGIRTGKAEVNGSHGHIPGVRTGNTVGAYERSPGHLPEGRSDARRSTGINPKSRDPILPEMPNLSPP